MLAVRLVAHLPAAEGRQEQSTVICSVVCVALPEWHVEPFYTLLHQLHLRTAHLLELCPTAYFRAESPLSSSFFEVPVLQVFKRLLLLFVSSAVSLQDFREPLYLTDTTVQIKDVRSAEERKYPQLFRHKLRGVTDAMHVSWQHGMPNVIPSDQACYGGLLKHL